MTAPSDKTTLPTASGEGPEVKVKKTVEVDGTFCTRFGLEKIYETDTQNLGDDLFKGHHYLREMIFTFYTKNIRLC